jgi:hypothetical protein
LAANISFFKKDSLAGSRWLTPVILATQKAEIRRIKVQSQPRQMVHMTLSRKYPIQKIPGRMILPGLLGGAPA